MLQISNYPTSASSINVLFGLQVFDFRHIERLAVSHSARVTCLYLPWRQASPSSHDCQPHCSFSLFSPFPSDRICRRLQSTSPFHLLCHASPPEMNNGKFRQWTRFIKSSLVFGTRRPKPPSTQAFRSCGRRLDLARNFMTSPNDVTRNPFPGPHVYFMPVGECKKKAKD